MPTEHWGIISLHTLYYYNGILGYKMSRKLTDYSLNAGHLLCPVKHDYALLTVSVVNLRTGSINVSVNNAPVFVKYPKVK